MANIVSTTTDIYDLVQDLLDGDEFQSDEAALRAMNQKYMVILSERDWYFLDSTFSMALSNLNLSQITDLDHVTRIYYVNANGSVDPFPLKKAPYSDRFNSDYDYWIDEKNKKIVMIVTPSNGSLQVDYSIKPLPLDFTPVLNVSTDTPLIPQAFRGLLAAAMVRAFKKADEAMEMLKENGIDEEDLTNAMIDDDNSHKEFYA